MERLTRRINGKVSYAPLRDGECVDIVDLCDVWGERLAAYEDAEEQGLLVRLTERLALAMRAGARAIENNRRYDSATYVYDVFGASKELSYREAAGVLREEAEKALKEVQKHED